ncbi:hypothetical protein pb186bvf_005644 [Paramecium bursaria]
MMKEQVEQLIQEMIPQIRHELQLELRPEFEEQFQQQLNDAKKDIQDNNYRNTQLQELKLEITQQILSQLEHEFEEEKQSLIHNVSQGLNKSRTVQELEHKLRQKIEREDEFYIEEETRKKVNLFRLNLQKQYEEEKELLHQQLSDEFAQKLQDNLNQLELQKQQINLEYQKERDKLNQIEGEKKQFNQLKQRQEDKYSTLIEELHKQIQILQDQITIARQQVSNRTKRQPLESKQKEIVTSIKSQCEDIKYDGLTLIDFDLIPDLFHVQQPAKQVQEQKKEIKINEKENNRLTRNTCNSQESQLISFNISQPSIKMNPLYNQSLYEKSVEQETMAQDNTKSIQQIKILDESKQKDKIINKLEEMCKQKLKSSQSQSIKVEKSQQSLVLDSFDRLFLIDDKDSNHQKATKQMRQTLSQRFQEDLSKEEKYFQQITYLKYNFTNTLPKSVQPKFIEHTTKLLEIWNKGHLSYSERLQILEQIINAKMPYQEIELILNECQKHYEQYSFIIEKLQQRQSFRQQIQRDPFTIGSNKKIFQTLKFISSEIRQQLQYKFYWREVDVDKILQVDQLEQQIIEKESLKEEIKRKEQQFPYTHQVKNDFNISNIKSDLNEQEKIVATDLYIQYHKNVEDLNKFLNIEYAAFQNKVNNCLLQRCYKNIHNDRNEVRTCVMECTSSVQKVQDFVERQFTFLKQDFDICLKRFQMLQLTQ